jgi:hypothetical protein
MKRAITVIALMGFSACGGGSGSNTPTPMNLSSAPGETALVTYLQSTAPHQYMLSATDSSGNSYTIQLSSQRNLDPATFNGQAPAYSTVDTLTLDKNGVLAANSISTSYYLLNPYVPLGKTYSTGTPYGLVTSSTPFPTTLNVGSSGPVDSLTYYHDSTMAVIDANETGTYSVAASNSTTLLMCLKFVVSDVTAQGTADGLVDDTESDCYSVDASGDVALVSITLTVNGETLTFE